MSIVFFPLMITVLIILYGKFKGRTSHLEKIIFLVLVFYIIFTIDLGINYVSSLNTEYNDGIRITGIFSRLVFIREKFSVVAFKNEYLKSMSSSIVLFLLYIFSVLSKEYDKKGQTIKARECQEKNIGSKAGE